MNDRFRPKAVIENLRPCVLNRRECEFVAAAAAPDRHHSHRWRLVSLASTLRPEGVDSSGADHALDAMRYGAHRIDWACDIKAEWRR